MPQVRKKDYKRAVRKEKVVHEIACKAYPEAKTTREKYIDMDALVGDGDLLLKDLGEHYGVSRERVRQKLVEMGLHSTWKTARRAYKLEKAIVFKTRKEWQTRLVEALRRLAFEKTKGDIPLQRAVEYYFTCNSYIPIKSLVLLFEKYYRTKEHGEKLSLKELGDETGINYATVGHILKHVGEEPLYWSFKRKPLTAEQVAVVEKAIDLDTELPYSCMERLTGIPRYIFRNRALAKGRRKKREHTLRYADKRGGSISYSMAMDLFEALDADFSKEEAMDYAGITSEMTFESLVARKDKIEKVIVRFKRKVGLPD